MSEWKAKRFWSEAHVTETAGGFGILLDTRPVKTPAKATLAVPTRAMADAIAAEWDAQEGEIKPLTMPVTRAANAAIDKVTPQHAEVADMVAAYGDADLLCYRADAPEGLIARQQEAWDPLLDWAEEALGARLQPVEGVMHRPQDPRALDRLSRQVHAMDAFTLTAFHDLVGLSGSLVIGFAVLHGHQTPEALWSVSRIDETWQEEFWGVDEEARQMALAKRAQFLDAKRFHDLVRDR
ncbi:ATP12 family chaperone protein [Roseovarius aestuariivivens]|uniref:ATP12 family chaperone protein n=1 Tax=Roseovarius aestuariivivens TaxID=1888910 RepID=UPI0010801F6B|nr:ATP12 family protein [Roseovarius aestuariivivens]